MNSKLDTMHRTVKIGFDRNIRMDSSNDTD